MAHVILAAGGSTRLGRPKQLLPLNGKTLLRRAVELGAAVGCRKIYVVLAREDPRMLAEIRGISEAVTPVINAQWRQGIGTSIKKGGEAAFGDLSGQSTGVDAVLFTTCDMPLIDAEFIQRLMGLCSADAPLAAAGHENGPGIPAIFGRRFASALASLPDQAGCKSILVENLGRCAILPLGEKALDIDTAEDMHKLAALGPGFQ